VKDRASERNENGLDWIKRNKTRIGVGAALVVGNTLAGIEVYNQQQRIESLESRLSASETLIENLIYEDVATTEAWCKTQRMIVKMQRKDVTDERIAEVCGEARDIELAKWHDLTEKINK